MISYGNVGEVVCSDGLKRVPKVQVFGTVTQSELHRRVKTKLDETV